MLEIYVADHAGAGINYYVIMVNGEKYDDFISTVPLTWSEQKDIAEGYREALDNIKGLL